MYLLLSIWFDMTESIQLSCKSSDKIVDYCIGNLFQQYCVGCWFGVGRKHFTNTRKLWAYKRHHNISVKINQLPNYKNCVRYKYCMRWTWTSDIFWKKNHTPAYAILVYKHSRTHIQIYSLSIFLFTSINIKASRTNLNANIDRRKKLCPVAFQDSCHCEFETITIWGIHTHTQTLLIFPFLLHNRVFACCLSTNVTIRSLESANKPANITQTEQFQNQKPKRKRVQALTHKRMVHCILQMMMLLESNLYAAYH